MSLYQLSKLLYSLNRDEAVKARYRGDPQAVLAAYRLTPEERGALLSEDIGLLYVLGVNGQILMHFAAFCGVEWADYLQKMRDGAKRYGPVRAGIYAMTTSPDEKVVE
jgi:hypothetical protein